MLPDNGQQNLVQIFATSFSHHWSFLSVKREIFLKLPFDFRFLKQCLAMKTLAMTDYKIALLCNACKYSVCISYIEIIHTRILLIWPTPSIVEHQDTWPSTELSFDAPLPANIDLSLKSVSFLPILICVSPCTGNAAYECHLFPALTPVLCMCLFLFSFIQFLFSYSLLIETQLPDLFLDSLPLSSLM